MVLRGHYKDGKVVFEGDTVPPDGAELTISVKQPDAAEKQAKNADEELPSAYEIMKPIIGIAKGLPPDAARNVDHYLYGHPKK